MEHPLDIPESLSRNPQLWENAKKIEFSKFLDGNEQKIKKLR